MLMLGVYSGARGDSETVSRVSPFMECVPAVQSNAASTQLELRGVVREGKMIYLTFYDLASKKWFTLQPGQQNETASVESFDFSSESAMVRINGVVANIAYRKVQKVFQTGSSVEYAATRSGALVVPVPAVIPATSPSEAERLSSVAAELRQRQEQQKVAAAIAQSLRS